MSAYVQSAHILGRVAMGTQAQTPRYSRGLQDREVRRVSNCSATLGDSLKTNTIAWACVRNSHARLSDPRWERTTREIVHTTQRDRF